MIAPSVIKPELRRRPSSRIMHALFFTIFYSVSFAVAFGIYSLILLFPFFHNYNALLLTPSFAVMSLFYIPVFLCHFILTAIFPNIGHSATVAGLLISSLLLGIIVSSFDRLSNIAWKTWLAIWAIWIIASLLLLFPTIIFFG